MMDICFGDLQSKLIVEEKMTTIHSALFAASVFNDFGEEAQMAVCKWVQGSDVSEITIGSYTVSTIINEICCSSFQAICVLNAINKNELVFEDAILVLREDEIIDE